MGQVRKSKNINNENHQQPNIILLKSHVHFNATPLLISTPNAAELLAACKPQSHYLQHPLNRRLGGCPNHSGWFDEEKNLLLLPGIQPHSSVTQPIA
jgi:hypothetical protein